MLHREGDSVGELRNGAAHIELNTVRVILCGLLTCMIRQSNVECIDKMIIMI